MRATPPAHATVAAILARDLGSHLDAARRADRLCKRNPFRGVPCWPNHRPVSIQAVMARPLTPTAVQGQDVGTTRSPDALPDRLRDVEHLEELMTTPSAALIAALQALPGDIIILGVGGKIGPTLARLAKRAAPGKRVVGVARFSEKGVREKLRPAGSNASPLISSTASRWRRCRSFPT